MLLNSIKNFGEKKNRANVDIKVTKVEKFLEFGNISNKFIIWKLMLSDFSGEAVFFCDEKPVIYQNNIFCVSDIKLIFHRGKKKFFFRKIVSKNKISILPVMYTHNQSNISSVEYRLL